MGKWCLHASSFICDQVIIKVAGNQDRHKSLVEFDFGLNQTTHFGVTCPWVTKISHFWTWTSLKPIGQFWSNFMCSIIEVGERLHKVLFIKSSSVLQVTRTDIKSRTSSIFLFLISSLQINRTGIKSWTSLKFGKIRLSSLPLSAEQTQIWTCPCHFNQIFIKLVDNQDRHEIWDEFETGPHCTISFPVDWWKELSHNYFNLSWVSGEQSLPIWLLVLQFLEKYQPLITTHWRILMEKDNLMMEVSQ